MVNEHIASSSKPTSTSTSATPQSKMKEPGASSSGQEIEHGMAGMQISGGSLSGSGRVMNLPFRTRA
jgi:hypothetical protein